MPLWCRSYFSFRVQALLCYRSSHSQGNLIGESFFLQLHLWIFNLIRVSQSLHASKHFWLVLDPSDRYLLTTMPPKQPGFSDSKSHSGPHNAYKSVCFSNSLPSPTLAFIASYLLWFLVHPIWCVYWSVSFLFCVVVINISRKSHSCHTHHRGAGQRRSTQHLAAFCTKLAEQWSACNSLVVFVSFPIYSVYSLQFRLNCFCCICHHFPFLPAISIDLNAFSLHQPEAWAERSTRDKVPNINAKRMQIVLISTTGAIRGDE